MSTTATAGRQEEADAGTKYDAFLSYTHSDHAVAVALQRLLERLTKPWYRRRQVRVFRDESSLAAGPTLWEPLEAALQESRYLVLLASVAAARSHWTDREATWWLEHKGAGRIILAVVDGDLRWDEASGRFDPATTTCLPAALLAGLGEEPHWIDLRGVAADQQPEALASPAAAIVAALTGKDKDEILGEDLRQHRRTRRTAVAALVVMALLAAFAGLGAVTALQQRNAAQRNATAASARAFAASSEVSTGQALDQALAFAAMAHRLQRATPANAALFRAVSTDPRLVRFVQDPAPPTVVGWMGDTHVLAEGGAGYLRLDDATTGRGRSIPVTGSVTAMAGTDDGRSVVVATAAHRLLAVSVPGGAVRWTRTTSGPPVVALAADRSSGQLAEVAKDGAVTVGRLADGAPLRTARPDWNDTDPEYVGFAAGGARLLLGSDVGSMTTLDAGSLQPLTPWTVSAGPADTLPPSAYVVDGATATFAFPGSRQLEVATVLGRRDLPRFPVLDISDTSAFAITPSLRTAALDADGRLDLVQAADDLHPDGTVLPLPGVSATDSRLAFSSDGRLLAATDGSATAVWSPDDVSGAARVLPWTLTSPCEACAESPAAIDRAASTAMWVQENVDFTTHLVCMDLTSRRVRTDVELDGVHVTALTVTANGRYLVAADDSDGVSAWTLSGGCPSGPRLTGAEGVLHGDTSTAVAALHDGSLLIAGARQTVVRAWPAGTAVQLSPPTAPDAGFALPPVLGVAPDGVHFVVGKPSDGTVTAYEETRTGVERDWRATPGGQLLGAAYVSAGRVALSSSGRVELLDARTGTTLRRFAGAQGFVVGGVDGMVVAVGGVQDQAAIWSADDGALLGTFDFAPVALPVLSPARTARATSGLATTLLPDGTGIWFFEAGTNPTRWDLDPEHWAALACRAAGRSVTPAEWRLVTGTTPPADLGCR